MRPIIFLDFDGVLNSMRSVLATGRGGSVCPDTMAVGIMNRLVTEANANVVVSSSWRIGNTLVNLREILASWGGEAISNRLVGKTPYDPEGCRGAEIARWLAEHPSKHDGNFVIVDDDGDMLDEQLPRFVQTRHRDGFGCPEYVAALKIIAPAHKDVAQLAWYQEDRPLSSDVRRAKLRAEAEQCP